MPPKKWQRALDVYTKLCVTVGPRNVILSHMLKARDRYLEQRH